MRREWSAVAMLAASCTGGPSPTQIFVVIDSDMRVPEDIDVVSLEVEGDSHVALGPYRQHIDTSKSYSVALPLTVGLRARSNTGGEVTVRVTGSAERCERGDMIWRSAHLHFLAQEIRVLCLRLDASCAGIQCGERTCIDGRCVSAEIDASTLGVYTDAESAIAMCGTTLLPDAGFDAGILDAEVGDAAIDAGDAGSISDAGPIDAALPDAAVPDAGDLADNPCVAP